MIVMTLKRDLDTGQETLGVLTVFERKFQYMERPWIEDKNGGRGGAPFISCVPLGVYRLERHERPSGEKAFILSNPALDIYRTPDEVPADRKAIGRTLCLIHAANWAYELHGCGAPGHDRLKQPARWIITESRAAMNDLRTLVNSELELQLRIEINGPP